MQIKYHKLLAVAVASCAAVQVGCASPSGKWSVSKVNPTAARADFAFASLTLQDDGTYYAEMREVGLDAESGTWTLKNGILHLEAKDGAEYTYDAKLTDGGNRMTLVRFWDGREMTATLKRRDS